MSLLEIQTQAIQLPAMEKVKLIRQLRASLTEAERDALQLEEAAQRYAELQSGTAQRVTGEAWYQREKTS